MKIKRIKAETIFGDKEKESKIRSFVEAQEKNALELIKEKCYYIDEISELTGLSISRISKVSGISIEELTKGDKNLIENSNTVRIMTDDEWFRKYNDFFWVRVEFRKNHYKNLESYSVIGNKMILAKDLLIKTSLSLEEIAKITYLPIIEIKLLQDEIKVG